MSHMLGDGSDISVWRKSRAIDGPGGGQRRLSLLVVADPRVASTRLAGSLVSLHRVDQLNFSLARYQAQLVSGGRRPVGGTRLHGVLGPRPRQAHAQMTSTSLRALLAHPLEEYLR